MLSKKALESSLKIEFGMFLKKTSLEQAKEYAADSEKFIFCVEFLEISADDEHCDAWVEALEQHFEAMLAENNSEENNG
jgi:hypothetical protein